MKPARIVLIVAAVLFICNIWGYDLWAPDEPRYAEVAREIYESGSFDISRHYVFRADSDYLKQLNRVWDQNLRDAFDRLPPIAWSKLWDARDAEQSAGDQPAGELKS